MLTKKHRTLFMLIFIIIVTQSCEDYVEVEPPTNKMVTETVFHSEETAIATVTGIFNELFNANFSNGYTNSVTILAGMSSDIFETTNITDERYGPFQKNEISPGESPDADANLSLWSSAYNIIYLCNSTLEGLANSSQISLETSNRLEGQVRFVRAFTYFYLVNLYGDVPLILSTDYSHNSYAERQPKVDIWNQINTDLENALILLKDNIIYIEGERTNVNFYVAQALKARVFLYDKDWSRAEALSTNVISQNSLYHMNEDPNLISHMNNKEAIWQITPLGGHGGGIYFTYTNEGRLFRGTNSSEIKLSNNFINSFQSQDKRLINWVGYNNNRAFYYPYKYKDGSSWQNVSEYSVVLRLAEQYLIRAEARVMQGNITGAIEDVDVIRKRAGLELIAEINPNISQLELVKVIMEERKKELFSEWGHRWLDLKRTSMATEVLSLIKPLWEPTDVYYPIPNEERTKDPNLTQNDGY